MRKRIPVALFIVAVLEGCGGGGGGGDVSAPSLDPSPDPGPPLVTTRRLAGFEPVSDEIWDETAVRKVLQTFAYGGHATDQQIQLWADESPEHAITEMLTFDQHNLLLSPSDSDRLDSREGTLRSLGLFWASNDPDNGINFAHRPEYLPVRYRNQIWTRAATSYGLNPFRQKIGLWETNYHMAVNRLAGVTPEQVIRYYDDILNALEQDLPYQDVLTVAALSAAVATQYGHFRNAYINGRCRCNEDFAREYYQLFFGILGEYDPAAHESVTIKNTAKALTGMPIQRNSNGDLLDLISFTLEKHYPGVLKVLNVDIGGTRADERISQISQFAIAHEESLNNLPVKIIEGLADDNLSDEKLENIRLAWSSMEEKSLLDFLRAYAISDIFHDAARVKFLSSIDRHLLIANAITLNNEENYLDLYSPDSFEEEGVTVFIPVQNVFGGQTGAEAAVTADIFKNNYDRVTKGAAGEWYRRTSVTRYGRDWKKDWAAVVPQRDDRYRVRDVAEWLWTRFIGDGLKNFSGLERMHVYALLATDQDIGYLFDPDNPDRVFASSDLLTDAGLAQLVADLENSEMALASSNTSDRYLANRRIGQAINFIVATPYIFAQEGR